MIRLFNNGKEIPFKSLIFPGGEPHVDVPVDELNGDIHILAHVGTMNDFMTLLALTDAVDRERGSEQALTLYLPYFPGARQDRHQKGFALSAEMFAGLLNYQFYDSVYVLDPHSEVTMNHLDRSIKVDPCHFIDKFIEKLDVDINTLLIPDSGAVTRNMGLRDYLKIPNIRYATKKRDPSTGRLSGFSCDNIPDGNVLIVDDICDGGGTFIALSDLIKQRTKCRLFLWTTHGIYSKGISDLLDRFEALGCTDSFPNKYDNFPGIIKIPCANDKGEPNV